jgi:hypothetical protein
MEDLDSLVMVYKNCPNYVRVGCSFANVNVIEFFPAKVKLLEPHEVELGET